MDFELTICEPPKPFMGRRRYYDTPLPAWQRWRRHRERVMGKPDPVLVKLNRSTFQKPMCPKNNDSGLLNDEG